MVGLNTSLASFFSVAERDLSRLLKGFERGTMTRLNGITIKLLQDLDRDASKWEQVHAKLLAEIKEATTKIEALCNGATLDYMESYFMVVRQMARDIVDMKVKRAKGP